MHFKYTKISSIVGILLSVLLCGQVKCSEESPRTGEISEEVSSAMMKYYAFAFLDSKTSDILSIDIKAETGNYFPLYDGIGKIRNFSKIIIWWPDVNEARIDRKLVLEKCLSLLQGGIYGESYHTSDKDKLSFDLFAALCGANNYMLDTYSNSAQEAAIRKSNSKDKIKELIQAQKVSFQDSKFNSILLEGISRIYPTQQKPIGLYVEYFDDPSNWNLYLD